MLKTPILALFFLFSPLIAHAGLFRYQDTKTELWGFKDAKGRVVIEPQFQQIYATTDEVFVPNHKETQYLVGVIKNARTYRISQDGKIQFESVFFDNGADYYEEGLARFIDPKSGKVGFHNMKGKVIIKPEFDFASPFRDGVANVCNGCHAEYPQKPTYAPLSSSSGNNPQQPMYLDVVGGKWGTIDRNGKVIAPIQYNSYDDLSKNHAKH